MNYKFFTPEFIADLMIELLNIKSPTKIIDLCAGDGALLLAAKKRWESANYIGIDIQWDKVTKKILEDEEKITCIEADALYFKKEWYHKNLNTYDVTLANPPFDAKRRLEIPTSIIKILNDLKINLPAKCYIEEIFTLLNINLLKKEGAMAIILPSSIIASESGKWLRTYIVNNLRVSSIVELPRNIFKNVDTVTYLLLGTKGKKYGHKVNLGIVNTLRKIDWKCKTFQDDLVERMDPLYHISINKNFKFELNGCIRLKELLEVSIRRGYALYGEKKCLIGKQKLAIPFWHTTNIKYNKLFSNPKAYIHISSPAFRNTALTQKGDILMARVGKGCVGKTALVWSKRDIGIASDCLYIIRPQSLELSILIFSFLQCETTKTLLKGISKGSGSAFLPLKELRKLSIPNVKLICDTPNCILELSDEIPWNIIEKYMDILEHEMNQYLKLEFEEKMNQKTNIV